MDFIGTTTTATAGTPSVGDAQSRGRPSRGTRLPRSRRTRARLWFRRPRRTRGRERLFDSGDLKLVILQMIAEKPSYGYELIREMAERLSGGYAPSPGSRLSHSYAARGRGPRNCQHLRHGEKRSYTITEAGRTELKSNDRRLKTIFERLEHTGREFRRGRSPELMRAFMNLRGRRPGKGVARGASRRSRSARSPKPCTPRPALSIRCNAPRQALQPPTRRHRCRCLVRNYLRSRPKTSQPRLAWWFLPGETIEDQHAPCVERSQAPCKEALLVSSFVRERTTSRQRRRSLFFWGQDRLFQEAEVSTGGRDQALLLRAYAPASPAPAINRWAMHNKSLWRLPDKVKRITRHQGQLRPHLEYQAPAPGPGSQFRSSPHGSGTYRFSSVTRISISFAMCWRGRKNVSRWPRQPKCPQTTPAWPFPGYARRPRRRLAGSKSTIIGNH